MYRKHCALWINSIAFSPNVSLNVFEFHLLSSPFVYLILADSFLDALKELFAHLGRVTKTVSEEVDLISVYATTVTDTDERSLLNDDEAPAKVEVAAAASCLQAMGLKRAHNFFSFFLPTALRLRFPLCRHNRGCMSSSLMLMLLNPIGDLSSEEDEDTSTSLRFSLLSSFHRT